jgi:hypothetical protein
MFKKYSDQWFRNQPISGTNQEKEDHTRFVEDQIAQETNRILNAYADEPGFRRQVIMRLAEKELAGQKELANE